MADADWWLAAHGWVMLLPNLFEGLPAWVLWSLLLGGFTGLVAASFPRGSRLQGLRGVGRTLLYFVAVVLVSILLRSVPAALFGWLSRQ